MSELKKAQRFSLSRVGYGSQYSKEYDNFAILMNEENAINALKELILNGTKSAQTFGLLGLRIKSPTLFSKLEPKLLESNKMIETITGCNVWSAKISLLFNDKSINSYNNLEKKLEERYQWLKSSNTLFQSIGTSGT